MKVDRRRFLSTALTAAAAAAVIPRGHATPYIEDGPIRLWPDGPPGAPSHALVEAIVERSADPAYPDRAVTHTTEPRLAVFRPETANGMAVMIMPGGGYQRVVIDKEGYELGRWLAARGYHAFVLFYRLPGDGWQAGPDVALADAQRGMRVIRAQAADFGFDAERVAALGFSAGGHACATLVTRFAASTYTAIDTADRLSARPAAAGLVYPVISMSAPLAHAGSRARLIGANAGQDRERQYSPDRNVPADAPPCFLLHAEDDDVVSVGNTLVFRDALRARGIDVETHLFSEGGHGFGLRGIEGKPADMWPELFERWLRSRMVVSAAS